MKDPYAAEDLTAQAFVQVVAALQKRDAVTKPAGYLMRTAQRLLVDEVRRRKREQPSGLLTEMEPALEGANTRPARPLPQHLASFPDAFDNALRALPEPERDAFILTELRGLTTREAGEVLGVSRTTVSRRHSSALELMQDSIHRA